jgi:dihydroorotase-like cyclic amidohydrolase
MIKYILENQDLRTSDIESESRAAVAGGITTILNSLYGTKCGKKY